MSKPTKAPPELDLTVEYLPTVLSKQCGRRMHSQLKRAHATQIQGEAA